MAAASKTASGFQSMPHRNGTYMASHGSPSTADVTPDLHLKMSKKIAQLTKVIYALNTKNDEHDNVLENLKGTHEEEMQQLMAETTEKMNYFKSRLNAVSEQRQKIDLLESHLTKERLQREEALSEFETFKQQSGDHESRLRSEYSEKILDMSKELLAAKKQFEDRLKDFHATRKQLEEDRDVAVEALSTKHHEEMDLLMQAHRVRYDEVVREKEKLEKEFQQKLALVQSNGDNASEERRKIEAEYQEKVDKLKAFYENELAASRAMQRSSSEAQIKEWEDKERLLKSEFARQERVFKDRISELLNQLSDGEQQMLILRSQLNDLESKLQDKNGDSAGLAKQLEQSRLESAKALRSLRESESELTVSKKRCEEQGTEIARQSMQVSRLDAAKLSQEVTIKELKLNTSSLQNRLNKLESEHELLEKKLSSQTVQSDSQMQRLQQEIEKLSREKADLESKYHAELQRTSEQSTSREKSLRIELEEITAKLKKDHKRDLDETTATLNKNHESRVKELQRESLDKLTQQETDLREKSELEVERLGVEKNDAIARVESQCSDLRSKLKSSEEEVERLNKLVCDSEKGLGSASCHIDSLKVALNLAKEELLRTQKALKDAESKSAKLIDDINRLQKLHDSALKDADAGLNSRLESLTKELDSKWSERLREECSKLRSQLNDQHREENRASLEELTTMKDFQRDELRTELQNKIDVLKKTIGELRSDLERANRSATMTELELHKEADLQRRRLEEEIASLSHEHNKKLHELEEKHKEEIKRLEALKSEDLKELENKLLSSHREEMTSQLQTNKLTIDAVKSQAERKRQSDIEELKMQHENDQENMRSELLRVQQEEMQRLNREFEVQLAAMKLQLQRTKENHTKDETEHQNKLDELRLEIEQRDCQIQELDEEIRHVGNNVGELQRELQAKGQEILGVRREANSQIRKREEDLGKAHQKEVDSMVAVHLRETQALLMEFNRSKELLTDKISALQLMLEEAEEKFRNRQSRPEDLDIIEQLKRVLAERELDMRKLVDEKRYFQLELLNRETNFNKVFKTTPNIGVINPLQAKTKPRKEAAKHSNSFGVTTSRLDPIPDMPVHEKRLNNSRPLPPTPPKDPPSHRKTSVY